MSGSGSFAVSRCHGADRFYDPPSTRRHRQELQLQQLRRPVKLESSAAAAAAAAENRIETDDSIATKSEPPAVCSSSPRRPPTDVTNLDRLVESLTPSVRALYFSEENVRSYSLGDLWESFREWSAYGVGVPLLLNGKDSIVQYYVPFLSGIQLYVDSQKSSSRFRKPGEESDVESSREQNVTNSNSRQITRLPLREKSLMNSSSAEAEICTSPGTLAFEYLEKEQPRNRKPLTDQVSFLVSQFPDLRTYRSSDLLPASWIAVAWYPIYRIPMGPTLRDLDASFLTFHSLSTHCRSNGQPRLHRKVHGGVHGTSKASLPVFGLASYKLKGSILTPSGPSESQQETSLLQAADNLLNSLQVDLQDYKFFRSLYSEWR